MNLKATLEGTALLVPEVVDESEAEQNHNEQTH
jgi:hypothetical protein